MTNLSDIAKLLAGESLDNDPIETREWLDSFDALLASEGKERAGYRLQRLVEHTAAREVRASLRGR